MKGVSPLISTILLIAFTISVAGIISVWLTTFARTSSEIVSSESTNQLICSYGGIALSDVRYSGGWLSGEIENTRTIALGNLTLQTSYTDSTSQTDKLYVSLMPREIYNFNISISSNYDKLRVTTNCSSIYDEIGSGDIIT